MKGSNAVFCSYYRSSVLFTLKLMLTLTFAVPLLFRIFTLKLTLTLFCVPRVVRPGALHALE